MKYVLVFLAFPFFIGCRANHWAEHKMDTYLRSDYIIKVSHLDDHQSFIEAYITHGGKEALLKEMKFSKNLDSLMAGKYYPPFLKQDDNHIYNVVKGVGPYAYTLVCLEKTGNTMIIYEVFEG